MKTLIINLKAYREAIDDIAAIAKAAKEAQKLTKTRILVAAPYTLIRSTSQTIGTLAQGIGSADPGAHTGHITWYEIKKAGALGTLVNHSENRLPIAEVRKVVSVCKKNSLQTYVCVRDMWEAKQVLESRPTGIAYEPPELIGGKVSVASAKPELIRRFANFVRGRSQALVGAGISSREDVKRSAELGADGVLVSSSVIKAADYKTKIRELIVT